MTSKSKMGGSRGSVRLLGGCLAVQLSRLGPNGAHQPPSHHHHHHHSHHTNHHHHQPQQQHHYWMYDSGYLLFQGFLEANLKCFWDGSLVAAVRGLEYRGYVCPGVLLVAGNPCALEVLRAAWSRNLLKPPSNYAITLVGDIEECLVSKVQQGGFTPLPDAICWVVLQIGASGQNAVLNTIKYGLANSFPSMEQPSTHLLYDALADLMANNKIYQTSQGYFVTTPDSIRLGEYPPSITDTRPLLMTTAEAISMVHGEMTTIREGSKTHQGIQTNLADVICGGNKNDKIMYPRVSSKGHVPRKLERRHSLRLLSSSRRLATLHRAGSVRLLQNAPSTGGGETNPKKSSLLSRLFRWSKRQTSVSLSSFPDEYPPQEWFNSTVLHLHSVGTQTQTPAVTGEIESDWSQCRGSRRRSLSTSRLPRRGQPRGGSGSHSRASSPSTASSSKTAALLLGPPTTATPKSISSASSGYNSLPRSVKSVKSKAGVPPASPSKSTIKVEVSANQALEDRSTRIGEATTTMTTTINGPNATKIFVQQRDSPIRSVITVENARKPPPSGPVASVSPKESATTDTPSRKTKRPTSLYQQKDKSPPTTEITDRNNEIYGRLENRIKTKFPSTETVQLEEKFLQSNDKNMKNCLKKEFFSSNNALKAGSLVDVAFPTDTEKNNVRKASLSLSPLQPAHSNDKVLESLSFKNVLKDSPLMETSFKEEKYIGTKTPVKKQISTNELMLEKDPDIHSFPSLSDLSVHFTSIAAQNILKGVSINSIDALAEVSLASEKQKLNREVGIHTDLGVV